MSNPVCQECWSKLREKIEEAGLAYAQSDKELAEKGVENDSLMAAFLAIVQLGFDEIGMSVLSQGCITCQDASFIEKGVAVAVEKFRAVH